MHGAFVEIDVIFGMEKGEFERKLTYFSLEVKK